MRLGSVILTAGLVLAASLVPHRTAEAQATKLRVTTVATAAWLPSWVAKEHGIFEKNGLDVDIQIIPNLSTTVGALGRQLELSGCTAIDVIKARGGNIDIVAVSGNTVEAKANRQMRLLARPESGVKDYKGLAGKTIATPSLNGVIHIASLFAIQQAGVDLKSLRFVELAFPNMPDQLRAGRVDAAMLVEPFTSAQLRAGNVDVGSPMLEIGDPVLFTCWMASGAWARANGDVLARWVRSLEEAHAFIRANDGPARAVLQKYTKLPDAVIGSITLPAYSTAIAPQDINRWVDVLRAVGEFSGSIDARAAVVR